MKSYKNILENCWGGSKTSADAYFILTLNFLFGFAKTDHTRLYDKLCYLRVYTPT